MDPKDAKKLLVEHSNALNVLLHKEGLKDVESKDVDADETLGSIEDRDEKLSFIRKAFKKVQKIPVVETFSNLGVAGSVAVTSAAVTQTEIAKDSTEVFVAEVAEDIVQKTLEEEVKEEAEEVKEELNSEAQNESRQSLIELPRVVTPENDTTIVSPVM